MLIRGALLPAIAMAAVAFGQQANEAGMKPKPPRPRCRLFIYKKADPAGTAWRRWVLDDRFEHHDGTKLIELSPGRVGIISHGWSDNRYVHLWEPV